MAAASLAVLSACAPLGPDYQRPAPVPNVTSERAALDGPLAQYKEAAKLLKPATSDPLATAGAPDVRLVAGIRGSRLDALMSEAPLVTRISPRRRPAIARRSPVCSNHRPVSGRRWATMPRRPRSSGRRRWAARLPRSPPVWLPAGSSICGGESGAALRPECQRCRQRRRSGSHHAQLARSARHQLWQPAFAGRPASTARGRR